MEDAEYLRKMAAQTRASVGNTAEGKEHAARLDRIAKELEAGYTGACCGKGSSCYWADKALRERLDAIESKLREIAPYLA